MASSKKEKARAIETETTKVKTGKSPAVSSHLALFYNLISPHTIRRLALRKTVGAKKYGRVQWRQGINDADFVADRFNHLVEHLLGFMESGNRDDDNLGGMLWALDALVEIERLSPESLSSVVGITDVFGPAATALHRKEMADRERQS